jgi:hypothetical protein
MTLIFGEKRLSSETHILKKKGPGARRTPLESFRFWNTYLEDLLWTTYCGVQSWAGGSATPTLVFNDGE